MTDRIVITTSDYERLSRLISARRTASTTDHECLNKLEQELERADIVEPEAIPADVVTMNSEVQLLDLDLGELKVHQLVYPTQGKMPNAISILAPIGTGMLGYRVGDVIEWEVPKGVRRLKVMKILHQPEAAGDEVPAA